MKKLLFTVCALLLSVAAYAQTDVTQFLGIPVDGSKTAMIERLKAKGFTLAPEYGDNALTGEFNGSNSIVYIGTNNNKVCRIMVTDATPMDAGSIRIRFNILCEQFKNNPKYVSFDDYSIPEDEDIRYEITVHDKKYDAIFYQAAHSIDSAALANELRPIIAEKYTPEQLAAPTEEIKTDVARIVMQAAYEKIAKKPVWFRIMEKGMGYSICLFYDNEYNRAQGEDL